MWIVSWNLFLMKKLLKSEICGPVNRGIVNFCVKKKKKKTQSWKRNALNAESKRLCSLILVWFYVFFLKLMQEDMYICIYVILCIFLELQINMIILPWPPTKNIWLRPWPLWCSIRMYGIGIRKRQFFCSFPKPKTTPISF